MQSISLSNWEPHGNNESYVIINIICLTFNRRYYLKRKLELTPLSITIATIDIVPPRNIVLEMKKIKICIEFVSILIHFATDNFVDEEMKPLKI